MYCLLFIVTLMIDIHFSYISCYKHVNLTSPTGRCVRAGQQLILNCSLHGDNENNEQLFFKRGTKLVRSSKHLQLTDGITSSSITIPEAALDDQGTYICCRNMCSRPNEFDSGMFEVGDIPSEPLYFHCMLSYARVNCYFSMHDSCVEWTLHYHLSGENIQFQGNCTSNVRRSPQCVDVNNEDHSYRTLWRTCRDSHTEEIKTRCPLANVIRDETYLILVEGTGPYGTSSFGYNITTDITIERLGSLRNFKVSTTSTTANLAWYFPNNPRYYSDGIACNITYNTNDNTTQSVTQLWKTGKDARYALQHLKPYRKYSIRVTCRFNASRYWSKSNSVNCSTKQDAPMYGPQATLTSYTVNQNIDKTYTIAIYIKPPAPDTINGILVGYELQLVSSPNDNATVLTKKYAVTSTLFIENVPAGTRALYADISSLTVAGKSRNNLQLNISLEQHKNTDSLHVEVVSVNEYPDHRHVVVKVRIHHNILASSHNSDITYIYHWCQQSVSDYECKDRTLVNCSADYEFAYSNQTQRTIVLQQLSLLNYSWVFGASIASPVHSEGLRWETCIPYGGNSNSTTYSIRNTENLLGLLAVLLPLLVIIIFCTWKRYRHHCAAYDIEVPGLEHEDGDTSTTRVTFTRQSSDDKSAGKLENANEENEDIRNSEYSRLHRGDNALSEGNATASDQELCPLVDNDTKNADGKITSSGNDGNEEETGEKERNQLNDHGKNLSKCHSCQEQDLDLEIENKKNNLSNYVKNIPGDTPRAATDTPSQRGGKAYRQQFASDDSDLPNLKIITSRENDGNGEEYNENDFNQVNYQGNCQELEIENKKCDVSNYVQTIPGDTPRAGNATSDQRTGKACRHHSASDDFELPDLETIASREKYHNEEKPDEKEHISKRNFCLEHGIEHEIEKKRTNLSNYVQNIPGDTPRAATGTLDQTTGKLYPQHCAAYECELSGLETMQEYGVSHSEHVSSTRQPSNDKAANQQGTGNVGTAQIRNNAYCRLHIRNNAICETSGAMTDQNLCSYMDLDREKCTGTREVASRDNDGEEEQTNEKEIKFSEWNSCQEQEIENKRINWSNYVQTIPGDTSRASAVTADQRNGHVHAEQVQENTTPQQSDKSTYTNGGL